MALDLLGLELQAAVSGVTWVLGLNSGPLEEQQVLLISESFLQPPCACVSCLCVRSCVHVHYVHVWCPRCSEAGVKSHGTRVIGVCGPLCGHWEQTLTPLQEQYVLITSELSLQFMYLLKYFN